MTNSEMNPGVLSGKAIIYERIGGPEVIKIIEHSVRPPEAGEVRIKVKAAGVNPTDEWLRKIENSAVRFPVIPGADAAGIIESVGPGVSRLQVGEKVMAALSAFRPDGGAQAEFIVVPAASVVPTPKGTTFEQAATLPMNGLTAFSAIELAGLKAGEILAVTGGAGLLAHYTIAIARKMGITVIADAKHEESELVRSYGANIVVERGDGFTDAIRQHFPAGVDALIDTAVLVTKSFPAIRNGGVYIAVRRLNEVFSERDIQIKMVWGPDALENTEWLYLLQAMVEGGEIELKVARTYAPEQVVSAQQTLAAGGLRGRPVILF
jgi:NADPH:quinone reductase-like Zn-dependent oxidoreductase